MENLMLRFSDYLYASVPGFCLAVPVAQLLPDLTFLQGIEKLGIIGIMAAGILFFVMERRNFIAKSAERLEMVENRLGLLETKAATGNDKVIHLLGQQLEALKEIKNGQAENFSRMWQLTLRSINCTTNNGNEIWDRFSDNEKDVLRPGEDQTEG
jgi:hypothetical protein